MKGSVIIPLSILLLIHKNGGMVAKNAIYEYFKVSHFKINKILKGLEKKRYIRISNDEIFLTPIGRLILDELRDLLAFS